MQHLGSGAAVLTDPRTAQARHLPPDLRITVRCAALPDEQRVIQSLRWQGSDCHYDRYAARPQTPDTADNVVVLLAFDEDGRPIGSVRLMDRRHGRSELDGVLDARLVTTGLPENSVEVAQFCALSGPSYRWTKLLLWKAVYWWCAKHEIEYALLWARGFSARDYVFLGFSEIAGTTFAHPRMGGLPFSIYAAEVHDFEIRWRQHRHPLYGFMFGTEHPNLRLTGPP